VAIAVFIFLSLLTVFIMDRIIFPWYVKLKEVVVVPDIRGIKIEEASEILIKSGLKPYLKSTRASDKEPGIVLDSDPPPGMRVKRGRKVGLIVSSSPKDENEF